MPDSMSNDIVRAQLLDRRFRVNSAMSEVHENARLADLLKEIDAALERIDAGTYGICEICQGVIEADILRLDPLVRVCFDDLSQDQRKAIERDLELASGIQAHLLPKNHVRLACWDISYVYEPAGSVSGDYCDVIRRPGGFESTLFFVGDVSGKGVAASLLMSQLQAIFRTLADSASGIEEMVGRANRMLSEATHSTHFATLVCVEARAGGAVAVCNAGHPRPLLLRKGAVSTIEGASLPLGLFFSGVYESSALTLEEDDLLLLYTDGVTECTDATGKEYGEARLHSALQRACSTPPREVLDTILADMRTFRGATPRADDLTLMAIRLRSDA